MTALGIGGAFLFALGGSTVWEGLARNRVPARWPIPAIGRADQPWGFWFFISTYLVAAGIGLALALKFLL